MENQFLTLNNYELENVNGGIAPALVYGVIKAGCAIAGAVFTLGAISGAAKAYREN